MEDDEEMDIFALIKEENELNDRWLEESERKDRKNIDKLTK